MQLAILTAVLAAIAVAEMGGGPIDHIAWRLVLVAGAAVLAPAMAFAGARRLAKLVDADCLQRSAARLESAVLCLWLLAVALQLVVARWPRIVRGNWQLQHWPLVDEVVILLPVLAPLLFIWASAYRIERHADSDIETDGCRKAIGLARYLLHQARHHLGVVLIPPLAVVGLIESLAWLHIGPTEIDTAWWFMLPLLATMLLLMPLAVRRIWHTTSLPAGPLRELLMMVCRNRKCRLADVLVWHTGGTMVNAAVVGMLPWLRQMLLSDALLARLADHQIAAVVRHELGHLRRWHLLLRLGALLAPVVWWAACRQSLALPIANTGSQLMAASLLPPAATSLAAPIALLIYAVVVVGWYSRLLEHDADLDAALDDRGQVDAPLAADFCAALVIICGRGTESILGNWLHPPVEKRVELIRRAMADSRFAAQFRSRLKFAAIMLAVLLLLPAALLFL